MNTLSFRGVSPILITRVAGISPGTCNSFSPCLARKTWKLHAQGKGFGKAADTDGKNDMVGNKNNNDDDDDDEKISPLVWDRMIVRILFYVVTPMVTGVVLLNVFGALKEQKIWDVPLWLPFLTTLLAFGTSALGIAYGTLSTSLDPDEKGSLLGWEQVQHNWPELWKEDDDNKRR